MANARLIKDEFALTIPHKFPDIGNTQQCTFTEEIIASQHKGQLHRRKIFEETMPRFSTFVGDPVGSVARVEILRKITRLIKKI